MKAYDKVHKHYQDLFNAFKPFETVVGNPTFNQVRDGLRSYNAFSNDPKFRLSEDNDTDEWSDGEIEGREVLAESIIDQFSRNPITGDYEDVPEYDRKLIKALTSGLDKNDFTIEDAFKEYLKIKKEETPDKQHKQNVRYNRVLQYLVEALGEGKKVLCITRQDAVRVKDDLLAKGQKPTTVARYLDDIKAVLNLTTREMDIPYTDKFSRLQLPKYTAEQEQRLPLPDLVIASVEVELEQREDPILGQLWTILKFTGARPSEITMLLLEEVHVESNLPYLEIKPRFGHPLKTKYSKRDIPLTKTPLAAVKARLEVAKAKGDQTLFQKFTGVNGASNLSGQMMRVIRRHTDNPKHDAYSLRHNFRDNGRERVPENFEVRNAIEGRTLSGGEEARYGSVKLEWLYEAMVRINRET